MTLPPILLFSAMAGLIGSLAIINRRYARQAIAALADKEHAKQLLEESDLRFRVLTRATNEAVRDWNIDSDTVWWNRNVQTLFGYTEEAIGLANDWWTENVHSDERNSVVASLQSRVRSNQDFWSSEYQFRRADGSYAYILDRGYILRDHEGNAVRMIASMMDMTKRKREMELARARDAALESARLKSQFLANMSHEIRTPMNSIIGMTDILLHTELTSEQREFVEVVRMSGESLLTIINDILDFSKIEAGKLKFEMLNFELRSTVEEVTVMLSEQTRAKKLQLLTTIDPDVPEAVRGDPGRLRQVLTNLVSNAIKFTPRGDINIRVTRESESDAHVELRFEVTDTGIGVPEEARACLFQPFSQVDASTTRKYGGTGLGLAICKQLVNLMGGKIGCDSASGKGSIFWFTVRFETPGNLPRLTETSAEVDSQSLLPAQRRAGENVRRRIRVLIAEDNAFNQKVVLRQVREMGFGADAVANGIEALQALRMIPYDVVLMDCQMPEMDGYACAAEIRREEDNARHIPIIAMTAHVMKEDRDKCLAAGMDDFLSKPVRVAHLEAVLAHWINTLPSTKVVGESLPSSSLAEEPSATRDTEENRPAVSASTAPVDWEIFEELSGNNPRRAHELSERYLQQTTDQLAKLRSAIATGSAADLKRLAHSLGGSSAMCGMNPMVSLMRELEQIGQRGLLADAPGVFTQASEEFARIERFFRDQINTEVNLRA